MEKNEYDRMKWGKKQNITEKKILQNNKTRQSKVKKEKIYTKINLNQQREKKTPEQTKEKKIEQTQEWIKSFIYLFIYLFRFPVLCLPWRA